MLYLSNLKKGRNLRLKRIMQINKIKSLIKKDKRLSNQERIIPNKELQRINIIPLYHNYQNKKSKFQMFLNHYRFNIGESNI